MKADEPIKAIECFTVAEAELTVARLTAEGIRAVVASDDAGGMYPGLSLGRIRVLVRSEDLPRAQETLGS